VYHITKLTAVAAMHEVGCKLATGVDAPTFTVRLTQNVLYNGSLLTVDECQ